MSRDQFLVTWRSRARRGPGGTLPRRPRRFRLWSLLGLLAFGVCIASLIEIPQHVNGLAKVEPGPAGDQTGDDVRLILFVPAANQSRLQAGQAVLLQSDLTGERLSRAISSVEPDILGPEVVRERLGLGAAVPGQSSAVAVARFEPSPTDVAARTFTGRVYRAEVEVASKRLIALLPPIAQMLAVIGAQDGPGIVNSPAVQDQRAPAATPVPSVAPSVPVGGFANSTLDVQAEYYRLVSGEVFQTLRDYEQIPVDVPRLDPNDADKDAPGGESIRMYVRAPYQLNTKKNEAKQLKSIADASASLQALFGRFPSEVRQGKGSPAMIQAMVQGAVDEGEIRALGGGWPPQRTDIERWMSYFGIGVDCSAFVYEALARVEHTLTSSGKPGLVHPLVGPVNDIDSNDLATDGELVASPDELSPGDLMNLDQEEYDGHIRIVSTVERQGKSIIFTTAEAAEASINGPGAKQWRFPDSARFADLEQHEGGEWHRASTSDQTYRYWRRLPLIRTK